jgi:lycopene beta-cyclase
LFANEEFCRDLDLQPYHYNGERTGFYTYDLLSKQENITFINQKVLEIEESETIIMVNGKRNFSCSNYSTVFTTNKSGKPDYPVLQQHFIVGLSMSSLFSIGASHVYGFSVEQKKYRLCVAHLKNRALLEYTLFHHHLKKEEYRKRNQQYIEKLDYNYEIVEKSKAASDDVLSFWKANTKTYIGTSGGWTASTGYTFKNSDKKIK